MIDATEIARLRALLTAYTDLDERATSALGACHARPDDAEAHWDWQQVDREASRAQDELTSALRANARDLLDAALGEPTPEDREAAAWFAEQTERLSPTGQVIVRYRRAAEALERSPAAIRRAAIEDAAQVIAHLPKSPVEHVPPMIVLSQAQAAIRALAEAPRGQ